MDVPQKTAGATRPVPTAPGAVPLLGHAPALLRAPARFLRRCGGTGHDLVELRLGARRPVLLCTAEAVHSALAEQGHDFGKGGPFWDAMRPILGNGVGTSDGEVHRRHRRLLQPAFARSTVQDYQEIIDRSAALTSGSWGTDQPVLVASEMMAFTSAVTVRALLPTVSEAEVARFVRMMPVLTEGAFYQLVVPPVLQRVPTAARRRYTATRAEARDAVRRLVATARENAGDASGTQAPITGAGVLGSAIGAAHRAKLAPFSDEELADQVMTILFAGIETSANVLSWALYLLARHPGFADRIAADPQGDLVHRVLAETMRLYPPGWLFSRNSATEVELCGHRFAAGVDFVISPYLLHHDARVFPGPDRFDPDRWLAPTAEAKRSYLPFGLGHRRCLGEMLANAEMVTALAALCERWRFSLPSDSAVQPRFRSVLIPHDLTITVTPR